MKYRKFGKTGVDVSILGFGCMRLPMLPDSGSEVDEAEAVRMIRHGIDEGINYIDTAWPYHGGKSELITGRALLDGYRERVNLATKLPSWLVKSRADMDSFLDKQLEKLQTDHIDFYLLHSLNVDNWDNLRKHDVFDFIEKAKESEKIRFIGFSFHDDQPLFMDIIDAYDWDFCQIQYNFMDEDYQAGLKGLERATELGIGVVIMEPLRGGSFLRNIPDDIDEIWKGCSSGKSPADIALRFVWNHPGVGTALSGMSNMQQLEENLVSADSGEVGALTADESAAVKQVRTTYQERIIAACTNCKYCMPCPSGVDIPSCLSFLNNTSMYNSVSQFRTSYVMFFDDDKKASNCIECGQCEEACPQHLEIISGLKKLDSLMFPG